MSDGGALPVRAVRETSGFAYRRERLADFDQRRVRETVGQLRHDRTLPALTDGRDIVLPMPISWTRRVPDTAWEILYVLQDDGASILLIGLKAIKALRGPEM